jgi:L-ascorbate metabolism protein UlaG (beta-lactamase superfamily)
VYTRPFQHKGLQKGRNFQLSWINHSTFLIETPLGNILTDPIYSRRAGPFKVFGPKRVHAPGIPFDALPQIDYVLLSHDHYDHCDMNTLRQLARRDSPQGITPLANGHLLRSAGFRKIIELDVWERTPLNKANAHGVPPPVASVTLTPAQHWSSRVCGCRCGRLWGGFWLEIAERRMYFTGDTGYNEAMFLEIRKRLGAPDLAMIPIGAYEPRWFMSPQHCAPDEAVCIHRELESKLSVAMHWGCFRLTDEARDAPPRELAEALEQAGLSQKEFRILEPGETLPLW